MKNYKKICPKKTFGEISRMELMKIAGFRGIEAYEALTQREAVLDWCWSIVILGRVMETEDKERKTND